MLHAFLNFSLDFCGCLGNDASDGILGFQEVLIDILGCIPIFEYWLIDKGWQNLHEKINIITSWMFREPYSSCREIV